jgi:transporter family-2 protein
MNLWFCIAALVAGSMLPLQAGINSVLRSQLASPYYATLVSVIVSSITIGLACLVLRLPVPDLVAAGQGPWWMWIGGVIGLIYVFMALSLASKMGATSLVAAIIAGQLLASLIMDQFGLVGFQQHSINAGRIVGIILLFAGVVFIQRN